MDRRARIVWLLGLGAAGALGLWAWSVRGVSAPEPGLPVARAEEGGSDSHSISPGSEAEREPDPAPQASPAGAGARTAAARPEPPAESRPAEPLRLRGRIDFPAGAPHDPELTVVLRSGAGEGRTELFAAPNALGRFELVLTEDLRRATLDLERGYHYLREPLRLDLDRDSAERELVLEPRAGGRLLVRLVATDGSDPRPFEGLSVRVLNPELRLQQRIVAVDRAGLARFDGLPAGVDTFLMADLPGYAMRSDLVDAPIGLSLLPGRDREFELPIEREVRLSGTVRSPDGEPLERARVVAVLDQPEILGAERSTRTDAEGRFELTAPMAGSLRLQVDHPAFLATVVDLGALAPGEERPGIEVVLRAGSELGGTLRWPDGTPAAGVRVFLRTEPAGGEETLFGGEVDARLRTDEQGRFATAGLESAGPFELHASARPRGEVAERLAAKGFLPDGGRARVDLQVRRRGVVVGERDLELVLTAGEALRGRVVDPAGRPLARAWLVLRTVEGDREGSPVQHRVRSDDGSFLLRDLLPGTYTLAASAGAGQGEVARVEIPRPDSEVVLVAPLGASIAGQVIADGAPVAGAAVHLRQGREEPGLAIRGLQSFEDLEKETRSDARGRFEFPVVSPGRQVLEAELAGTGRSARVTVLAADGEALTGVVLELETLGWISGHVAEGIEGRSSRSIWVRSEDGDTFEIVNTDGQGRFELAGLRAGLYSLTLEGPDHAAHGGDAGPGNVQAATLEFDMPVLVEAGRGTDVVLAPPQRPVRISGRVLGPDGPCEELDLRVRLVSGIDQEWRQASTGPGGTFTLELPNAGRALFSLGPGDRGGWQTRIVPDQDLVHLDFHLPALPRDRSGD